MGLLDKFFGPGDIKVTPKVALGLAAMTIIGSDGVVDDEELAVLDRLMKGDGDAYNNAVKLFKANEYEVCISIVSDVLDKRQKFATLINLLDLAMADGVLAGGEKELLEAYIAKFEIPDEAVKEIVEFIQVKNDFSIFE